MILVVIVWLLSCKSYKSCVEDCLVNTFSQNTYSKFHAQQLLFLQNAPPSHACMLPLIAALVRQLLLLFISTTTYSSFECAVAPASPSCIPEHRVVRPSGHHIKCLIYDPQSLGSSSRADTPHRHAASPTAAATCTKSHF